MLRKSLSILLIISFAITFQPYAALCTSQDSLRPMSAAVSENSPSGKTAAAGLPYSQSDWRPIAQYLKRKQPWKDRHIVTIGIPKEIKTMEYRVAASPKAVQDALDEADRLSKKVRFRIQKGAGVESRYKDEDYPTDSRVEFFDEAEDVWYGSDIIWKVKEPQPEEYDLIQSGLIIFTYFHFAANKELTQAMLYKNATCIAYETVKKGDDLPMLRPMSEVAGKIGAHAMYLMITRRQVPVDALERLIREGYDKVPEGISRGSGELHDMGIFIAGGGTVGVNGAEMLLKMGATVYISDVNPERRAALERRFKPEFGDRVVIVDGDDHDRVVEIIKDCYGYYGAVCVPGAEAPKVLRVKDLEAIQAHRIKVGLPPLEMVLVDIDQNGSIVFKDDKGKIIGKIPTTTHQDPIRTDFFGNLLYLVPNMPSLGRQRSTDMLSAATSPYLMSLMQGLPEAFEARPEFLGGLSIIDSNLLDPQVQEKHSSIPLATLSGIAASSTGRLTQDEATEQLNTLPITGSIETLQAYYDEVRERDGISYKDVLQELSADLKSMAEILTRVRPVDELNQLIEPGIVNEEDLDILRGISEFILQFGPFEDQQSRDSSELLIEIKQVFADNTDISRDLMRYFKEKFNSEQDNAEKRGAEAGMIRVEEHLQRHIRSKDGFTEEVLEFALITMMATTKTDFCLKGRTELFFRIDPNAIKGKDLNATTKYTPPHTIIWVHIPYGGFGAHSRYANIARGGLRDLGTSLEKLTGVLNEAIALSLTQNYKHSGIPEGGSKGAYWRKAGLNEVAIAIAYIDGLINCMIDDDSIVESSETEGRRDPLELGPDVGTADIATLATVRAWQKGLPEWRLLMSGKLAMLGGVSHMDNDLLDPPESGNRVTSQGVWVHAEERIRFLEETSKLSADDGSLHFSITGNMTGDVASGLAEIAIRKFGQRAHIHCMNGSRVVAFDPQGFNNDVLLRLYADKASMVEYPASELNEGGFVIAVKKGNSADAYVELGPETLKHMNTRVFDTALIAASGLEDKYREMAGIEKGLPLVVVLQREVGTSEACRVRVHTAYLNAVLHFLVRSDMLLTGSTGKYLINDENWIFFFDKDEIPIAPAIVHGANVFITDTANDMLEDRGVIIDPDEKANSTGVNISSQVEMHFNMMYTLEDAERMPGLLKDYFSQVLRRCLFEERAEFWALRLESVSDPDARIVTGLSRNISRKITGLARKIEASSLVGYRQEDFHPEVLRTLEEYFPDVSGIDERFPSTLGRVFQSMDINRVRTIAAKAVAAEVVMRLGADTIRDLARETGISEARLIETYLEADYQTRLLDDYIDIIYNDAGLAPSEQVKALQANRRLLIGAMKQLLYLEDGFSPLAPHQLLSDRATYQRAVSLNIASSA
ncbi:MAG: NAD-glutamate dehydrogenase [Candidatus Omnitrophica bacterium]|nr:NAD-glutamate dehydrogenase [Candidatus Omnitrophota bacterium]